MAIKYFAGRVKDSRTIEISEDVRMLGLAPGDEVNVGLDIRSPQEHEATVFASRGVDIMRQIAERHRDRRVTDGSTTLRLLDEARAGAAYGYEPAE